jgi:hypothetical protein
MIGQTHDRAGLTPERLAADTGYGDAAKLARLVDKKDIEPHSHFQSGKGAVQNALDVERLRSLWHESYFLISLCDGILQKYDSRQAAVNYRGTGQPATRCCANCDPDARRSTAIDLGRYGYLSAGAGRSQR